MEVKDKEREMEVQKDTKKKERGTKSHTKNDFQLLSSRI